MIHRERKRKDQDQEKRKRNVRMRGGTGHGHGREKRERFKIKAPLGLVWPPQLNQLVVGQNDLAHSLSLYPHKPKTISLSPM